MKRLLLILAVTLSFGTAEAQSAYSTIKFLQGAVKLYQAATIPTSMNE